MTPTTATTVIMLEHNAFLLHCPPSLLHSDSERRNELEGLDHLLGCCWLLRYARARACA